MPCIIRTERDATNWSSEKLKELLMGLQVESEEGKCEITEVSKVEGEASINNRKGKLIFFYEWNLKADWRGEEIDSDQKINMANLMFNCYLLLVAF